MLKSPSLNKALFLDRDGVLIEDTVYPHKISDLKIKTEIIPFLKKMQEAGFLLFIMTNQSGIGRGFFSIKDFELFQAELLRRLGQEGVNITATYYCPYYANSVKLKFRQGSERRKPKPGMFLEAAKDYQLDLSQSLMIGDKESDLIECPELRCFIITESGQSNKKQHRYKSYDEIFDEVQNIFLS